MILDDYKLQKLASKFCETTINLAAVIDKWFIKLETLYLKNIVFFGTKFYNQQEIEVFCEFILKRMGIDGTDLKIILTDYSSSRCNHDEYSKVKFTVFINQLESASLNLPLETVIAHELKHYEQFKLNKLRVDWSGYIRWNNTLMENIPNWYDSPWEAEAVEYENKVAIELGLSISRIVVDGKVYDHGNRKATRG